MPVHSFLAVVGIIVDQALEAARAGNFIVSPDGEEDVEDVEVNNIIIGGVLILINICVWIPIYKTRGLLLSEKTDK